MAGNILLGKVSDVYDDFSSVSLIADKNNKVGAQSERAETSGGFFGGGGGGFFFFFFFKIKNDGKGGRLGKK